MVVRYASDMERKRLEYLLSRFAGRLRSERIQGAVVLVEGSDEVIGELLRGLYARIPRERIRVYKVEGVEYEMEPIKKSTRMALRIDKEAVWGAVELLARKLRGVLVSSASDERVYRLYVKGEVVDARFRVYSGGNTTIVELEVEGFGSQVEEVFSELRRELSYLAG